MESAEDLLFSVIKLDDSGEVGQAQQVEQGLVLGVCSLHIRIRHESTAYRNLSARLSSEPTQLADPLGDGIQEVQR